MSDFIFYSGCVVIAFGLFAICYGVASILGDRRRIASVLANVKPLTKEYVAAARSSTTEQEVSGGVDREPMDD